MPMTLAVHAGVYDHESPLVEVSIAPDQINAAAPGTSGVASHGPTDAAAVLLHDTDAPGGPGGIIVAQYDATVSVLRFVLPGRLVAGTTRHLDILPHAPDATTPPWPVEVTTKLDRAVVRVGGQPFTSYHVFGGRRPYLWPVIGPAGASVVRGQGSADHPHHTGLGLAYGGHSEDGSVNIWSDWDEPPYGPGGRMIHRGFRRIVSGPVYGEVAHDLTWVDTFGNPFAEEWRTLRFWWASEGARFIDTTVEMAWIRDRGRGPLIVALRLPSEMDIPQHGAMTNSAGVTVPTPPGAPRAYRAAWVDGSGPSGDPPYPPPAGPPEVLVDQPGARPFREGPGDGPWQGIAIFGHPTNNGFPHEVGRYAGSMGPNGPGTGQITLSFYPPAEAPHGPFAFTWRTYVHRGDAIDGKVAAQASSYQRAPTAIITA